MGNKVISSTYRIEEVEDFCVVGMRTKLTSKRGSNLKLAMDFWKVFNEQLRKNYMQQFGAWTKYAFMEREEKALYYFCAVPKKVIIPNGFIEKKIKGQKYLVATHEGKMTAIYETYDKLYKDILPSSPYKQSEGALLHFEKYDERFRWEREDSKLEIWVPVVERVSSFFGYESY